LKLLKQAYEERDFKGFKIFIWMNSNYFN
jgi:hypothetical protein